jgi:hypothetical protein
MKILFNTIPALLVLFSFTNCASGKKLQETAPAAVEQAYFTTWTGGVKTAGSGFNLFIPVSGDVKMEMDSVFFRGKKSAIEKELSEEGLYVARFKNASEDKAKDIIMHADPKKEYGNKAPVLPEKIPFELEQDEAVVKFTKDGKTGYFRIKGIREKTNGDVKIKNPENIRH